ncbi:NAD(P)H-binding protein [Lysinibacter sp. HNR]|uniref:NmrA family NAD(P)-binding protein n=1 Tax=Lysinibacter sp. HNR TaxID=3031408 RepID=UPI00243596E8|nr:NAD(P)H-binding protein [Lysinibacter sp. HNR]WGD36874.1 NAD(P)H-binding protein [Lysinibacter sp. HNR]
MKILVTGATGWVGRAVVPELIDHGHEVTALVRSVSSAEAAERLGATTRTGSLDDLHGLQAAVAQAEGLCIWHSNTTSATLTPR